MFTTQLANKISYVGLVCIKKDVRQNKNAKSYSVPLHEHSLRGMRLRDAGTHCSALKPEVGQMKHAE